MRTQIWESCPRSYTSTDARHLEPCTVRPRLKSYFYIPSLLFTLIAMKIVAFPHYRHTPTFPCLPGLFYSLQVQNCWADTVYEVTLGTSPSVWAAHSFLLITYLDPRSKGQGGSTSPFSLSPPHINQPSLACLLKWISLSVPSHLTRYQLEMALKRCSVSSWDTFHICQKPLTLWQGSWGHNKGEKER